MAVGVVVGPQRDGVALLLIGRPEQAHRQEQHDQREDGAPLRTVERALDRARPRPRDALALVGRQRRGGEEIDDEPDGHADAGGAEAVVPAGDFAERAGDQRGEECAEIDADIEDRIGAVAARIAGRVERADLRRDVGLERAVAEDQHQQRKQEQRLERHHEMADRHQRSAKYHGAALAEHAIGQHAAKQRRQIDERGVEAVDVRGERLRAERAEDRFIEASERAEPDHVAGVFRQQHELHHVEHEQRAHPVIRKALPHLGGEQEGQAARVPEKLASAGRSSRIGDRHRAILPGIVSSI